MCQFVRKSRRAASAAVGADIEFGLWDGKEGSRGYVEWEGTMGYGGAWQV